MSNVAAVFAERRDLDGVGWRVEGRNGTRSPGVLADAAPQR
ncbi:hypothetical protein ACFVXG_30160 [Kitasatospora sp. NPDC058162]